MGEGRAELLQLDPLSPLPKMSYKDGFQKRSGMQKCNDHGKATDAMLSHNSIMALPPPPSPLP